MFSKCLDWFEQETEADAIRFLLRKIKDKTAKKSRGMLKQINQLFKITTHVITN